jgi:peptide/nickel transport system substrate-binding protein
MSACSNSEDAAKKLKSNYDVPHPTSPGGTMIDAMTGEPSGLIAMIAGESAASAIAGLNTTKI